MPASAALAPIASAAPVSVPTVNVVATAVQSKPKASVEKPVAPATTQAVSEDWDPQVRFNPAESVAVRRIGGGEWKVAPTPHAIDAERPA